MNDLREKWKQGIPTFGPFIGLNAQGMCEILGHADFDYCIIDLEHGAINLESAENMVRGAIVAGTAPIIRVAVNREELIGQALNLGAGSNHRHSRRGTERRVGSQVFFLHSENEASILRLERHGTQRIARYSSTRQ